MIERYLEQQPAVMAALMSPNIKREKDLDTLSSDDITLAEHFIKVLGPLKTITTIPCESSMPTLSMVRPLLQNLSQAMAPNVEDVKPVSQMKAAILNRLAKRYTDVEIKRVLLQASFVDPRFKALPFLSQQEKLEVQESLCDLAEAMNDSSLEYCIVKSEPYARSDPPLPDVPVQVPTAVKEEVVNPPKKTALSSLFGDVFVVSHVPATLTKKEMIHNELKDYTGEECADVNTNPLKWWHVHDLKYPFLSKVAKYLLCIPATSVPSERVFSTAGDIVTVQRATLAPDQVDKLIFLKRNVTI
ncbi:E3 SUMO-protein ligase ZBED1-like [Haliotis rubra]|uniref:E3 SUMO-protein ligase ZBED1-like n=1 Tax=Haliotis rubra TaxID=36100 RepID=UPI001EE50D6A|nr:E3 SUMO-protein ligase ZBED1-like [Haliotis rubra]